MPTEKSPGLAPSPKSVADLALGPEFPPRGPGKSASFELGLRHEAEGPRRWELTGAVRVGVGENDRSLCVSACSVEGENPEHHNCASVGDSAMVPVSGP